MSMQGKTVLITGGTRGIGKAMALKLAAAGANIVIAAKSVEEDPRLGGTIYTAAAEVEALGAKALAVQVDIRDEAQIAAAIEKTIATFGGLDILINNASAIQLTDTAGTASKRFDLMHDINVRGTFSKYNMSMMTLGWAEEFKEDGIAVNALWPRTTIDTAAVRNLLGGEALAKMSRTVDIIADAAFYILSKEKLAYTGKTFIDEDVLAAEGITDLAKYSVVPGGKLFYDLFL
jgi:citronellol/citronellal dehydrogenase